MHKGRLEAFSDGVFAIIITIMVLDLKVPNGDNLASLKPLFPVFISYVLSFIYLGIYWNNHHHMLHTINVVNGSILWANLHLLFWLSLTPFVTAWMGENNFAPLPEALYGIILLMASISYFILQNQILKKEGKNSLLSRALGKDAKGKISPFLYAVAIASTLFNPWISGFIYAFVAFLWLIPDKRIERTLDKSSLEKESKTT